MNTIRRRCNGPEGVLQFISCVQTRAHLWDPACSNDENPKETFEEILEELKWQDKVTVEIAQQAWKHLKTQYGVEKASIERNGREKGNSRWEYLDALSFLDSAKGTVSERSDYPRRTARYSCAVPSCSNTEKSEVNFRPVKFFDMPDGKDRRMRQKWQQAIPELESAVSPAHQKVCEFHFVDGRPTDDNPIPSLKLSAPEQRSRVYRKRKSVDSPVPPAEAVNKAKAPTLNSVLQAVAESAIKREEKVLSTVDACEPIKIPAEKSGAAIAKPAQPGKPRLLKLPLKTLASLPGGGFKLLTSANGVSSHSVVLNANGGRARVIRLVKPSTLNAPKPSTVASQGLITSLKQEPESSSPPPPKTLKIEDFGVRLDSDVVMKNASNEHTGDGNEEPTKESADERSMVKSEKMDNHDEEHEHGTSKPDDKSDKPLTLLSALQQTLGPVATTLATDGKDGLVGGVLQGPSLCKPVSIGHELTCSKCASDLPVLRRSLGRLESRVESMIAMVKTLCTRHAEIENLKKNLPAHPPVVLRPRVVPSVGAHSTAASGTVASPSGITVTAGSTSLSAVTKPGATVVRVSNTSDGQKLCVLKRSPRVVMSARVRGSAPAEDGSPTLAPGHLKATSTSTETPKRSVPSAATPTLTPAAPSLRSRVPSSAPTLTSKVPKRSPRSRSSSPDSEPPSLATRFMPASKVQCAGSGLSYLHKTVIRALLLYGANTFTVEQFRADGPTVAQGVASEKLRESLRRLINDGLLRPVGEQHDDLADSEATYEKERNNFKVEKLAEYGVSKEQYLGQVQ